MFSAKHAVNARRILFFVSLFFAPESARLDVAAQEPPVPVLRCDDAVTSHKGLGARIRCVIENPGEHEIFVLSSPFTLEGPSPPSEYIYKFSAGLRFENVLDYDRVTKGLARPILFKPYIHLTTEELSALLRVPAGRHASFSLAWEADGSFFFPDNGDWLLRPKLVFISAYHLRELETTDSLAPGCRENVVEKIAVGARKFEKEFVFHVRNFDPDDVYFMSDRCHDIISEKFEHVYSNDIRLTVQPK